VALKEISPLTIVWLRFSMDVIILGIIVAVCRQFSVLITAVLLIGGGIILLGVWLVNR